MALEPIDHNPQEQPPLTLALKNICRDYPAGGTVLRELLQNADDAGATCVRFVLDEKAHPTDKLIHEKLKQYQGPALLVYNDAEFTPADFQNLKQLGNSQKLYDGSTTGRFGRGFNSVYNWTDSPSIVSRERLLILDPHQEWSSGGPVHDFVKDSGDAAIKNHMAAFQDVIECPSQRLDGTVIRIPLRTAERATKSKISTRETTASEMREVLRLFASEFGDNGLLFMKNVGKLEIAAKGLAIGIEIADGETVRSHKLKVNDAVKRALKDPAYSFSDDCFEAGIEYRSSGEMKKTTFMVHHRIQGDSMDNDLREWATDQKLVPWVAVAAQLPTNSAHSDRGSLFTVLPLPILNSQPIHIHGLFSISPDRARLYQLSDRSAQDQTPAKWNDFLLQGPVPVAWAKLLTHLADTYPHEIAFKKWPKRVDDTRDILSNASSNVLGLIEKESLVVWPTNAGYVAVEGGLLATSICSTALKDALLESGAPVVYCPQELLHRAEDLFKDRVLCPQTLCQFLKSDSKRIRLWSDKTKLTILEYLLSKPEFTAYDGLEIFPFEDGTYQAIGERVAFLQRDELEKDLFRYEKSRNLDLAKLSEITQGALKCGCDTSNIHPSIRYRSTRSLGDYCMKIMFKDLPQDQDMVELSPELASFVSKVWKWISLRATPILDDNISCLWLLPLSNGYHRRIKLRVSSSRAYLAPPGDIGKLMWKFDSKSSRKPLPLLNTIPTGEKPHWVSILTGNSQLMSQLSIENASSIVTFLQWLHQTSPLDDNVAGEDKLLIIRLIAMNLPPKNDKTERTAIIEVLRHLGVFQRVSWAMGVNKMLVKFLEYLLASIDRNRERVLSWTNLSICTKSILLLDGTTPVPQVDDTQFLVADSSSFSKGLLLNLGLAKCLGSVEIIQDYIIPAWERGKAKNWTSHSKEQMAAFILHNFSLLPLQLQARLRTVPFVPVAQLNGKDTSQFALAADLIDPDVLELKDLFFNNECIVPKESFLRDFSAALRACGLKTVVDEAVVEKCVRSYANSRYPLSDTINHAKRLLRSTCRWTSPLNKQQDSIIRHLAWLPTVDINGAFFLNSSDKCRSLRDCFLVSSQLPTLRFSILAEWETRLGWDNSLPSEILLPQLAFGIEKNDRRIVDAVLTHIKQMGLTELLADSLKGLPCIVANSGLLIKPSLAFRPCAQPMYGCERLQPYLANVEYKFWTEHKELLRRLEIRDRPQISDLLEVQKTLEGRSTLDEADIRVAIEILNHATRFPRATWANLKVISAAGSFESIENINFDDLSPQKPRQQVMLTHLDIPPRTIQALGIVGLRERLIKNMLDIEDLEDEDEFDQREDVTTRIGDTLERYPIETTFREYLANADDAKGTARISWLLDSRGHSCEKLLTPEMRSLQGPAFLVHNDGMFSEDDFKGFKSVGEGSKSQDKEATGQFGRGSQTMYHWTDTPMILSGKYLVVLDPQQRILIKNKYKGTRMPGVKLLLSKLREACPDQLAPFEGLWGYTQSVDNYFGTIFRFPLRTSNTKSNLRTNKTELNTNKICRLMDDYFHEARISLLFLRKIKSIDFSIHGNPCSGWSVTRRPPLDEDANKSFSELVICSFLKNTDRGAPTVGKDKWWVVIQDLDSEAEHPNESSRRVMKNIECGLAALLPSTSDSTAPQIIPLKPRMFSTLPLPINSDLPVHVHATFSLSGDRKSIAIGEYGAKFHASLNQFLLQDALPKLYLQFLEDIGRHVRENVFDYWPRGKPPKESPSELLCDSFWEKLPKSSRQLFPKTQMTEGKSKRQAADLFTFSDAVFDFLPRMESKILLPLLLSLDVKLVRNIPAKVASHLKELLNVKTISRPMLRKLFISERGGLCLQKQMIQCPSILGVLVRQLTEADESLQELDGCYILPLADDNIVTLKYLHTEDSKVSKYYVVPERHLKLFKFASRYLVTSTIATTLGPILQSKKFNLERLRLSHVKKLLELKPAVSIPNPEADSWLIEFWKFWNEDKDSLLPSPKVDSFAFQIFQATRNGVHIYASPIEFHGLPAVIKPSIKEHQQICDRIPDLYVFDPKFMPKIVALDGESFYKDVSFFRLIRALRVLAGKAGMSTFVESHLDPSHRKVLQNLTIFHISIGILDNESEKFPGLRADLKSIPMWPNFHGGVIKHPLCANTAFMASNDDLLVPWMKECHRFVDPQFSQDLGIQSCLLKLGVKKLSVDVLLERHVLPLPSTLSGADWKHFITLISAISSISSQRDFSNTTLSLLKQSSIAADGNCTLTRACNLYDHEDQIFMQAFRHERKTKFLHANLVAWRPFWLKVGLRRRNGVVITAAHYLECLQVIGRRLRDKDLGTDPNLEHDCLIVLSPLTAPNISTQWFTAGDWLALSRERAFLSRTVFNAEPEFRKNCMAGVASERRLLCFSEIISYDHVAVCWSQTPFAVHQPTKEVLNQVSSNGRPTVSMVWRHLQHMRDLCKHLKRHEVQDFLADLCLVYDYLQDRLQKSSAAFVGKEQAIWLNLDSFDHRDSALADIKSCWYRIDNLVLSSSCDAEPMKAVRPGLMRYEKLLKALGCAFIVYPTVKRPQLRLGYSVSQSLQQLRREKKMLDITYSSEGKLVRAHRVVLAAASEKCAAQFSGPWKVEDVIKYDKDEDFDSFLSYHALSTMIEYAYGDEIDWRQMEVSEHDSADEKAVKLNMLLDLLKGADCWMMSGLKSQVQDKILVAGKAFWTLENIVEFWERANQIGASDVEKMCTEFIERNREILNKVHGEDRIAAVLLGNSDG